MDYMHKGPTFTQDEVVALREIVDFVGSGVVLAALSDSQSDLKLTADLLGSISKKLADSLAYLGDYR